MKKVQLILLRHGQSSWNEKNLFTGWVDVPLSVKGIEEAYAAGEKIKNFPLHVAFTSTLIRAQMTLTLALLHHQSGKVPVFHHPEGSREEEWGRIYSDKTREKVLPVYVSSELNERMYGQLQGLNKKEMADQFGKEQVHLWRRSFHTAPPEGESLQMTSERTLPYFQSQILPRLKRGENVLIAAHGNSLRSIVMHIEKLSPDAIVQREIPTGEPLLYTFDRLCEGFA